MVVTAENRGIFPHKGQVLLSSSHLSPLLYPFRRNPEILVLCETSIYKYQFKVLQECAGQREHVGRPHAGPGIHWQSML